MSEKFICLDVNHEHIKTKLFYNDDAIAQRNDYFSIENLGIPVDVIFRNLILNHNSNMHENMITRYFHSMTS